MILLADSMVEITSQPLHPAAKLGGPAIRRHNNKPATRSNPNSRRQRCVNQAANTIKPAAIMSRDWVEPNWGMSHKLLKNVPTSDPTVAKADKRPSKPPTTAWSVWRNAKRAASGDTDASKITGAANKIRAAPSAPINPPTASCCKATRANEITGGAIGAITAVDNPAYQITRASKSASSAPPASAQRPPK